MDFIQELELHVPEGEPIYEVDGSGYVGFFARRPIVNGDGLMNTHEYARKLVREELDVLDYLRENEICYVITNQAAPEGYVLHQYGLALPADDVRLVYEKKGGCRYPFTNYKLYKLKSCD